MSGLHLMCVMPQVVPRAWPHVEERVREVLRERAQGEDTVESVHEDLLDGKSQLWLGLEPTGDIAAIAITQISTYRALTRLRWFLVQGQDIRQMIPLMQPIEAWALEHGATEVEAWVRTGFRRTLEQHGFHKQYEVLVKSLRGVVQ